MRENGPHPEFRRTTHPDAQWFPLANFGLFINWGIYSVAGIQPSWAMIKDYPAGGDPNYHPPDKYYALASQFDPQNYDPDVWMEAASKAGFTYAVLTSKHHDGYALWPSEYGDMSTRQYMGGRDLLVPYVEACRNHGLRVGFYFSPTDWHYPGYPVGDVDFDYNKRGQYPRFDLQENLESFERFYVYTRGQIEELLTRYGKIDVLWFDGVSWPGIEDYHTLELIAWIRELQPGIVINNRWRETGDYETPECHFVDQRPSGWWEMCHVWQGGHGGWGYSLEPRYRPLAWVMENLVKCRAWGGNFLCNVGPAPDGTMHPRFYQGCAELAEWMSHSRESVIGALDVPGPERGNVPLTRRADAEVPTWYLHFLPSHTGEATVSRAPQPSEVRLLRTQEAVSYTYKGDQLRVNLPADKRTPLDDVVVVTWTREPEE